MDRYLELLRIASDRLVELTSMNTTHYSHTEVVSWKYDIALCLLNMCEAFTALEQYDAALSTHHALISHLNGIHAITEKNMYHKKRQESMKNAQTLSDRARQFLENSKN